MLTARYTSFRSIPPPGNSASSVHPLPLLCEPARSSGLRAVMIYASQRYKQPCGINSRQPLLGKPPHTTKLRLAAYLVVRIALLASGLLAHTRTPTRGLTPGSPSFALNGSQFKTQKSYMRNNGKGTLYRLVKTNFRLGKRMVL